MAAVITRGVPDFVLYQSIPFSTGPQVSLAVAGDSLVSREVRGPPAVNRWPPEPHVRRDASSSSSAPTPYQDRAASDSKLPPSRKVPTKKRTWVPVTGQPALCAKALWWIAAQRHGSRRKRGCPAAGSSEPTSPLGRWALASSPPVCAGPIAQGGPWMTATLPLNRRAWVLVFPGRNRNPC